MKISLKHLVLYPGCKRVSCGVSAFGQVFVVTQAKHWVPRVFLATWPLVASTFARPRNILPHARENPWYTGQGISFATTFKIHVTVFPVLFLCDLKLTLRLLVEIYLPFRHLTKQQKCCNLQHSLCFMSLWLFCYTSFEGIVNFWYESKLSLRPLTSNSLASDQLWPASWKFVSKSFELRVKL